jgi:hypothetical protein
LKSDDNIRPIGIAGEQNRVGKNVLELRTYSAAQLEAAQVGHQPVCDDHPRTMFREDLERLTARRRPQDDLFIAWQRMLDQFAGHGRVVHNE